MKTLSYRNLFNLYKTIDVYIRILLPFINEKRNYFLLNPIFILQKFEF